MRLAYSIEEILLLLSRFSLPKSKIMQESLAQISWYHGLLIIKELRKKESKLPGKIVRRSVQ